MTINPFILHGEEITPVRKLLYLKALAGGAPLSEYEATGNPVSFTTNVSKPLSVLAAFSPVQAGSGDPSPENVRPITGWSGANVWRTGANLIDDTKRYQSSSTTLYIGATNNERNLFLKAGKYTVTRDFNGELIGVYYVKRDSASEKTIFNGSATETTKTLTIAEDGYYAVFCYRASASGGVDTSDIKSLMIEPGETATAYSPYTGQSYPVTFPALGKNILNPAAWPNNSYYSVNGDEITVLAADGGSWALETEYPVKPGTYTFLRTNTAGQIRYRLGTTGSEVVILGNNGAETAQITVTEETTIRFKVGNSAGSYPFTTKLMLAEGTVSAFEPFTNTAYGGTLDLTTGVLTIDKKCVSLNDPDKWTKPSGNIVYDVYFNDRKQNYRWEDPCTCFPTESRSTGTPFLGWAGQTLNRYAIFTNSSDITLDDVKALATAGKIFCVYELAVPLVYQLPPVEILSLVGDNTLWSDLNGDLTVTYKKKG